MSTRFSPMTSPKIKFEESNASRGFSRPKECKGCDSLTTKPQTGQYPVQCEGADEFCRAFELHVVWVAGILEGETCYKAKYEGIS